MQNRDEALLQFILATGSRGILVKMLITLESHYIFEQILNIYIFFEIGREKDKEKIVKLDSNTFGLRESVVDHMATTYCIYILSNLPISPLPVLVR